MGQFNECTHLQKDEKGELLLGNPSTTPPPHLSRKYCKSLHWLRDEEDEMGAFNRGKEIRLVGHAHVDPKRPSLGARQSPSA